MSAIKIVELPPQKVAYFRSTKGYDPAAVKASFGRLGEYLANAPVSDSTEVLGLGWDNPKTTPLEECRYDAAFTLTGEAPAASDGIHELPGGTFVHYRHVGSYDKIDAAFQEAQRLIAEDATVEFRPGVYIENYRNDPATTPVEKLITDLYLPVKKI